MALPRAIRLNENSILNVECIEEMLYVEDEGVKLISVRTANGKRHSFLAEGLILDLWKEWKDQAIAVTYPPEVNP